jgi:ABC-type polysaccharide/polyol phosphate export permease
MKSKNGVMDFLSYIFDIFKERSVLMEMSKRDFKSRFLGSQLGMFWAFFQPIILVLVYWFVFTVGFKSVPVDNVPFVLWLVAGIVPWFFFSEAFYGGSQSITSNAHLVKKVVFKVNILPSIKIFSAFYMHAIFLALAYVLFLCYGYKPQIYHLQILYYEIALFVLLLGFSLITSALVVFLKDIGEVINVILQIGFYVTPIFWSTTMVPDKYLMYFKLNPMYYIVEGYRESLIYHKWFWESPALTLYFWLFAIVVLLLGIVTFKRLRPHFSDVL